MRAPVIIFDNLVRQLLPHHKRQTGRLGILRAFIRPLAELFDTFRRWQDQTRRLINVTNQKGVLEQFLRNKYNAPDITIESYREMGFAVGLRPEGEETGRFIGLNTEEGDEALVPLRGEEREQFGDVDFIVHIPADVNAVTVEADTERYRAALTTFKIEQQ